MNVVRFNQLTLVQQCYYTMKMGAYLATYNDADISIDLYEVNRFYVEVYYMKGATECSMAKAYAHTVCLNKYLPQISIAALFC
jgi:hypothetical protein